MASREGSKYGHLVKEIHIQDRVGIFDKYAVMDGEFFGWDAISIRYGLVGRTGCITEETDKLHTHDYDQLIWLVSADPYDMLELGAELEVVMGLNGERHRIATPTALHIPAGTPHTSPIVTRLDRKFFFVSVNCTGKLTADVVDDGSLGESHGFWGEFRSEYKLKVRELHFARKGPYHYGSAADSDSGGIYAHLNHSITDIPLTMTWQTITKPHFLGPRRSDLTYGPHVHDFPETLIFLSLDQDDLTDLHAVADFSFGEEGVDQEVYTVTRATAMTMPGGVYHLPLEFKRVDRPLIFISLSANAAFSAKQQKA